MNENSLKTILLLGILTSILLAIGGFLGGTTGLTIAITFSIAMNLITYFFSDKIVLTMYGAREADPKEYAYLHRIVTDVSKSAGIPKPRVYIVHTDTPNAFATGRNPAHAVIACTTGILRLLTQKELEGVIAHEISHVKNRDILVTTIAATIAGVISYAASIARFSAIFGGSRDRDGNGIELLVLAILTPIIATIIQLAISRRREYLADETGAHLVHNPHALADALEKLEQGNRAHPLQRGTPATSSLFIVNPFSTEGLIGLLSTHPPLKERVVRLRRMNVRP